jgi:hypothetical protein
MRHLKLAGCVLTGAIAITALAPAAGLAAASAAPTTTTMHVKAFSIPEAKKVEHDLEASIEDDSGIAAAVFQKDATRRNHMIVYPTGKALRTDLLRLSKKLKGRIRLGSVPSAANGHARDFYLGDSTARTFKVASFFHVAGRNFRIAVSIGSGGLKSLKETYGTSIGTLLEALSEVNENHVADAVFAKAHTRTSSAHWTPAYLTGASLARYVKSEQLWDGDRGSSARVPPSAAKAVIARLYLGATTTKTFSEAAFFPYKKGWKLKVKATRGLTGPAKLTVTAVKDH